MSEHLERALTDYAATALEREASAALTRADAYADQMAQALLAAEAAGLVREAEYRAYLRKYAAEPGDS